MRVGIDGGTTRSSNPSLRFKVQGSLLFVTYTIIQSIISSEMQVELKKQHNMRKVRRKNNPQTMLLGEYSVRTGKTAQQHKSTYTIDTRHSHRGSESGPASSHPVPQPLIRRWSDPLDRLAVQSKRRRVVGGGAMSECL